MVMISIKHLIRKSNRTSREAGVFHHPIWNVKHASEEKGEHRQPYFKLCCIWNLKHNSEEKRKPCQPVFEWCIILLSSFFSPSFGNSWFCWLPILLVTHDMYKHRVDENFILNWCWCHGSSNNCTTPPPCLKKRRRKNSNCAYCGSSFMVCLFLIVVFLLRYVIFFNCFVVCNEFLRWIPFETNFLLVFIM